MEMSPAHEAVEMEDLRALYDLIKSGCDVNEEYNDLSLLHHVIDLEVGGGSGVSVRHFAFVNEHWLALCLMDALDLPNRG